MTLADLAALAPDVDERGPRRYSPHEPTAKQAEFLALDCSEALYGGAAGGGKSDALLMGALQNVHVPGYAAILFRRTHTDLALPGALLDRAAQWLHGSGARWSDRDKTWTFSTEGAPATVSFGYLDGPRDHFRYASAEFQFIGFDELSQFEEKPYRFLFSRLRRKATIPVPLRMRGATNPGGIGHEWIVGRWGLSEEGHRETHHHDGRVFVPALLEDNPHVNAEEYAEMLKNLDPVTYEQLRNGKWVVDSSGRVYSCFTEANVVQALPKLPYGATWRKVFSADFGVTDDTAFGALYFSDNYPDVYLVESSEWPGLSPSESAELYRNWEARHGDFDAVIGDTSGLGKAFAQEWTYRFAIPIEAADKPNKLGYIKLMNGDMHHRRFLVVREGNEDFIRQVKALLWKDEKQLQEHPALKNHLTDMALYGWRKCRHWDWSQAPKPPPADPVERRALEWQRRIEREVDSSNDSFGREAKNRFRF